MTTEIKPTDVKAGDRVTVVGWRCNMADFSDTFTVDVVVDDGSSRMVLTNRRGTTYTYEGSRLYLYGGRRFRTVATDCYLTRA
jgi:hypothetical protein